MTMQEHSSHPSEPDEEDPCSDSSTPSEQNNDVKKANKSPKLFSRKHYLIGFVAVLIVVVVTVVAVVATHGDKSSDDLSTTTDPFTKDAPTDIKNSSSSSSFAWTQVGTTLYGQHTGEFKDAFGRSVALSADGNIVAAGVPGHFGSVVSKGHVQVFSMDHDTGTWKAMGQRLDGEAPEDAFGMSVALSKDGSILAAGSPYNDGNGDSSGHVRVFRFNATIDRWTQMGQALEGDVAGDLFGDSVALSWDGKVVAAGAPFNDVDDNAWSPAGHVRVFHFDGMYWNQMGQDLDGEANFDAFGSKSVALSKDGSILAAGGPGNDGSGVNGGHVRVLQYNGSRWNQLGQDIEGRPVDAYGSSVDLSADGHILVAGGTGLWPKNGQVTAYQFNGTQWNQMGQQLKAEQDGDQFGKSVAISSNGRIVAASAPALDDNKNGIDGVGRIKVFAFDGTHWIPQGLDLDGQSAGEWFGSSVALSSDGKVVAGGSPGYNVGNAEDVGSLRVYRFSSLSNP